MPTRRTVLAGSAGVLAGLAMPPVLAFAEPVTYGRACERTEAAWRTLAAIEARLLADGLRYVRDDDYDLYGRHLRAVVGKARTHARYRGVSNPAQAERAFRRADLALVAMPLHLAMRERFRERAAEWGLAEAHAAVQRAEQEEDTLARRLDIRTPRARPFESDPTQRLVRLPFPLFIEGEGVASCGALTLQQFSPATYARRMEQLPVWGMPRGWCSEVCQFGLPDEAAARSASRLVNCASRVPGMTDALMQFEQTRPDDYRLIL